MDVTLTLATPDLDPEAGVEAEPLEGTSKVVAMAPAKYVFSYARADSTFVLELAQRLRQAGVDLWLDQLDIVGGQRWDRAIESALESCRGMIAVLSPESIASNNVMDEVSYALEEGKQLVPVLLRPCDVPFRLRRVQHIDFTRGHEAAFPRLLKALGAGMKMGEMVAPRPVAQAAADVAPTASAPPPAESVPSAPEKPVATTPAQPVTSAPAPCVTSVPEQLSVPAPRAAAAHGKAPRARLVDRKLGAVLLLAAIFFLNLLETNLEASFMASRSPAAARLSAWGDAFATASRGIESGLGLASSLSFTSNDEAPMTTVVAYSSSYFFLFPVLCLIVAVVLARRKEITPFRIYSLALAMNYAVSLPFFLLLPVPERWAHPDSGAMLLSDRLSSRLIDMLRPMSGLDNCFPSFHVSMTTIAVLVCFRFRARLRMAALGLGATVALSTVVLGIHWVGDVLAGAAVATLSVAVAVWLDARLVAARVGAAAPVPQVQRPVRIALPGLGAAALPQA